MVRPGCLFRLFLSLLSPSSHSPIDDRPVDRPIPPVAFNGLNVAEVDTLKLLGVSFDRHLT